MRSLPIAITDSNKRRSAVGFAYGWICRAVLGGAIVISACEISATADDLVELRNGGTLSGRVVGDLDSGNSVPVTIELADGGSIQLLRGQVGRVHTLSPEEIQYNELAAKVEETAEAHFELATWCGERRLSQQRETHLLKAIQLDPNHEDARHALKFSLINGRWMTREQLLLATGRRTDGTLLQEAEFLDVQAEYDERMKEWKQDLRQWRSQLGKQRHAEFAEKIAAVRDPAAVPTIAEILADEQTRDSKLLWINLLGNIDSPMVVDPLVRVALLEDDEHLRDLALNKLEARNDGELQRVFMSHLNPNDNSPAVISRAGVALARLGDREAVRSMIEALVTKVRVANPNATNPGNINSGFSNTGGFSGSFGGGNQPRTVDTPVQNPGVLTGLRELTGVDFGFDKSAWLNWLVQEQTPKGMFDLRRDQ